MRPRLTAKRLWTWLSNLSVVVTLWPYAVAALVVGVAIGAVLLSLAYDVAVYVFPFVAFSTVWIVRDLVWFYRVETEQERRRAKIERRRAKIERRESSSGEQD